MNRYIYISLLFTFISINASSQELFPHRNEIVGKWTANSLFTISNYSKPTIDDESQINMGAITFGDNGTGQMYDNINKTEASFKWQYDLELGQLIISYNDYLSVSHVRIIDYNNLILLEVPEEERMIVGWLSRQ